MTGSIEDVGTRPWGIAISADGRQLYTANGPSGDVSVIDTATREVVGQLPVGNLPEAVVVAPDGSRAYVVNSGDATMSIIDTGRP